VDAAELLAMKFPASFFEHLGNEAASRQDGPRSAAGRMTCTDDHRFRAKFGTSPRICAALWHKLEPETTMSKGARPVHLLWGLMLMKIYATEAVLVESTRLLFENGHGSLLKPCHISSRQW
jgi:hypothetical protein